MVNLSRRTQYFSCGVYYTESTHKKKLLTSINSSTPLLLMRGNNVRNVCHRMWYHLPFISAKNAIEEVPYRISFLQKNLLRYTFSQKVRRGTEAHNITVRQTLGGTTQKGVWKVVTFALNEWLFHTNLCQFGNGLKLDHNTERDPFQCPHGSTNPDVIWLTLYTVKREASQMFGVSILTTLWDWLEERERKRWGTSLPDISLRMPII